VGHAIKGKVPLPNVFQKMAAGAAKLNWGMIAIGAAEQRRLEEEKRK